MPLRLPALKVEQICLFLLFCVVFLWINQGAFALGYFGEDYMWLFRTENSGFLDALRPTGGFYRPLAVNLPYFLFTHLANGLYLWKVTALIVTFAGYLVLWLWLTRLTNESALSLGLATFWLFHPSNAYGIYYANAFDYVLSAPLLIFLLYALELRAWKTALALLAAACLSKELAFGFPLLFLLRQKQMPWWVLAVSIAGPICLALVHHGFAGGMVGGFSLSLAPKAVYRHFLYLGGNTFFGRSSWWWHCFGWLLVIFGAISTYFSQNRAALNRGGELLLIAAALFLPLCLFNNILTRDLGPIYWALLLASAALGLHRASPRLRRWFGWKRIAFLGVLISAFSPYVRNYNTEMAEAHKNFVDQASERLAGCGLFDRVVLSGLETIDPFPDTSEWLVWGLMRKFPKVHFYLLPPPAVGRYASPYYPLLWVEEWQAAGHPRLQVSKMAGLLRFSGPDPACQGKQRESAVFQN